MMPKAELLNRLQAIRDFVALMVDRSGYEDEMIEDLMDDIYFNDVQLRSTMADKIVTPAQFDALKVQQTKLMDDWYNALKDAAVTNPPPVPPPASSGRPSGLSWTSGVNPQPQSAESVTGFEAMRGRKVDIIVIHPSRDSWDALNASWAYTEPIPAGYLAAGGRLCWSMPLWPGNGSVSTNYDAQWAAWARKIKALDPRSDVRLGWEMNLPNPWHVNTSNRLEWIAAFNRAANAIKTAAPNVTITFNPNWGADQTGVDVRTVFQQVKQNVDHYGIDYYDAWEPVLTDSQASSRLTAYRSLVDSAAHAKANGKKFCIPEWAVASNSSGSQWAGHAGGDNPRFVKHVLDFVKSLGSDLVYEAYFDEPHSYIRSSLRPPMNPLSAAQYRASLT